MSTLPPRSRTVETASRVAITPLVDTSTFADRAYAALKDVIVTLDIYDKPGDVRLDERQIANDLGISRTPVREAMAQLEREGFVRSVPRRGIYVVRKTRAEVSELITAWAALESMAARLITQNATDPEIAELRPLFAKFENGEQNTRCPPRPLTRLNARVRDARPRRSIRDHRNIIQAIEARDTERAEDLVR